MTLSHQGSSLDSVQLHYASSFEDIERFWRWLGERHANNAIALDIETTGLDHTAHDAAIRLVQFGDTVHGWAIPAQDWGGLIKEVLAKWDGLWLGHNAVAFDGRWMRRHLGWELPRHRTMDTMIAASIIDPIGSVGLKPLSDKLIDRRASFGQDLLHRGMQENGWTWATVPLTYEPYSTYSAMDVVLTAMLWDQFKGDVWTGGRYSNVMDLEMSVRFICSTMEDRGMRVDTDYCESQLTRLRDYDESMSRWAREVYGVSLSSNAAVARKLTELGAVLTERTAGGALKVDKETLAAVAGAHGMIPEPARMLAEQVLRARNSRKIASTYFAAMLERTHDGIIHPEIRTMGARTGRMSVSNPALQQIPKKDGYVRNAFVPRNPGELLLSCDYSQVELRMMGNFSKDEGLAAAFRDADASGGDFFVNLGVGVYNDKEFKKSDSRRGLLKNTMYGRIYGASTTKMAATAGVPVERMAGVVEALDKAYPGIKAFMKEIESVGKEREASEGQGYVMTPSGRRLPCDNDRVYTLTNYCVSPDTPVLQADLKYVPASSINVGDRLAAFDEHPRAEEPSQDATRKYAIRKWRTASVEAVSTVTKPSLRITLADGRTLVCSDDHMWLQYRKQAQGSTRWVRADELLVGSTLFSIGAPWETDTSGDGRWLSGMFDGGGCMTERKAGGAALRITLPQEDSQLISAFETSMRAHGVQSIRATGTGNGAASYVISSIPDVMRVLGGIRPMRFVPYIVSAYSGRSLGGDGAALAEVVSIEAIGMRELVAIQTSTRTFVANGVLSHNCIQSSAADVLKRAMVRLDASEWGEHMLLPVHDEVLFSVPREKVSKALAEIPEIMGEFDHAIPLKAEIEGGFLRWGHKSTGQVEPVDGECVA